MYRSILLPLDGSPFGEHALQLATTLARRSQADLKLIHVHNPVPDSSNWEPVTPFRFEGLEKSQREWDGDELSHEVSYLADQAKQIRTEIPIKTTCKIVSGPIVAALEQEIEFSAPDVVVMSTHGRGGFSRSWLGSVADTLVRHVHTPLLLVRAGDDDPIAPVKVDNILVPLDGSTLAESIVPHALQLADGAPATFTLLCVVPPLWIAPEAMSEPDLLSAQELKERVQQAGIYLRSVAGLMKGESITVRTEVVLGTAIAGTILEWSRHNGINLIAMATHGRGGWQRLLIGSVADKVLRSANIPVLVYHPAVG